MTKEQKLQLIKALQEACKKTEDTQYKNCLYSKDVCNIVSSILFNKQAYESIRVSNTGPYNCRFTIKRIITPEQVAKIDDIASTLFKAECIYKTKGGVIRVSEKLLKYKVK